MKTYVGIVRDHSGSMFDLANYAKEDFNLMLNQIKQNSNTKNKNFVSVVECGVYGNDSKYHQVNLSEELVPVEKISDMKTYKIVGGTPLYDSVGCLIEHLEKVKRIGKKDAFLVNVITDGQELHSRVWGNQFNSEMLSNKIKELESTGRWTFVFRVPHGYKKKITKALNLSENNVIEWEQTESGFKNVSVATSIGTQSYFDLRSSGATQTRSFFKPDLSHVNDKQLKATLVDVKKEVKFWNVKLNDPNIIRDFCEEKSKASFLKGAAFYQLVKKETVQAKKQLAIRNKKTGAVYIGDAARDVMGLPKNTEIKVAPGEHGEYDVYVQSTSVNRKLPIGTNILYWSNIGTQYKSGISSR